MINHVRRSGEQMIEFSECGRSEKMKITSKSMHYELCVLDVNYIERYYVLDLEAVEFVLFRKRIDCGQ